MSEETPTARDGRPGCPVTVWDGPYSTRCGAGASTGTCAHHGPFATTTPVTSAAETPEFTGAVSGLTLTSPGPGKVIWPDGTEVSAEQFQNSVTAATTGFEKGQAAGRRMALLEAGQRLKAHQEAHAATMDRAKDAEAKVARVEALAHEWIANDTLTTMTRQMASLHITAALAEPERDEEPEEIHHCDGCGEDYNILAESHVGHQIERDPAVTTWDELRKQRKG